jgi:CubicO group peptidase (beta-lactamase class C family)
MHLFRHVLPLLPICITSTLAEFLVGSYPPPLDLSSDESIVPASWKNFTAKFDAYLKENQTAASESLSGVENVTFSVGLFSLHDPAAANLQYHYTSPEIANAVNGTDRVDGDSIYRMASVTKLFTVFAGMLELTDKEWNRPLTEVFPELAEYALEHPGEQDPVYTIQWDKVTPWAFANHLAGFPAGGLPGLDLLSQVAFAGDIDRLVTAFGFPPADLNKLGPCWNIVDPLSCAPEDFIKEASSLSPSFLPWASPAYTNPGMMMLGLAISKITGKSMETIYHESIFQPLGMTSSKSTPPTSEAEVARSVVVGDPGVWFLPGGITTPAGGLLSTINDLSKYGVSILNSTLFLPN